MLTAVARAFRTPDLRKKLLFTLLIMAIWAFRRRREISKWWRERRESRDDGFIAAPSAGPVPPAE